jgi:hypothetical protein
VKRHPSELSWFRFHAHDLPVLAWLSFRFHALRCDACGTRLRNETRARAAVEALLDRAKPAGPSPSRAWIFVSLATAAAVAIVLFIARPKPEIPNDDGLRTKGGSASFVLHVAVDGGTDILGERCQPGDALQAEYRSDKPYVLVVGVDPANQARTLIPLDGAESMRLAGKGVETAPQSWVVDEAQGRERFVAFFSDAPIDSSRARSAALRDRPELEGAITIVRECTKVPR